ncbi:MAG: zf-HC2 domain-containing protein [Planctomycetes bacterium]|nr:zf-HC2 domain-containing protein [Planctomycetota bacterium]
MMTCRELKNLLLDFVSGELPPEHKALVEQHLHKCPPCEVYLETYQLTIQMTRQLPCGPLPQPLVQRLQDALAEIQKEGKS